MGSKQIYRTLNRLVFGVLLVGVSIANAQNQVVTRPAKSQVMTSKKNQIGVGGNALAGGTSDTSAPAANYSFVSADFNLIPDREDSFRYGVNAGGMTSSGPTKFQYVRISELYFDYFVNPTVALSAGRKKLSPLSLEKTWNLGVVEPVFNWNPLRPESVGLTHVGVLAENDHWKFQASFLPLFIPDQGANYQIKDGKFKQTSPWFSPPPDQFIFLEENTSAVYSINMPETKDVVTKTGYFLSAGFDTELGFFGNSFYTEKPVNQPLLSVDGKIKVPSSKGETPQVLIALTPQFVRHQVIGGELGYGFKNLKFAFATMHESLTRPETSDDVTTQVFPSATYLSPSVVARVYDIQLTASYLRRQGDPTFLEGEFATSLENKLPTRMPYKQASLLGARWKNMGVKWVSDLEKKSHLVSGDIGWLFSTNIKTTFSFDLISYPAVGESSDDFFQVASRDDRIGFGVQYVF